VIAEQSFQRVLCNIKQLVKTSSDFSSVFRERVAEHKNPQGISENKTCAGMGIQFSKIPLSFFCFQERSQRIKSKAQYLCAVKPLATGFNI
jgi:hypothetical protein